MERNREQGGKRDSLAGSKIERAPRYSARRDACFDETAAAEQGQPDSRHACHGSYSRWSLSYSTVYSPVDNQFRRYAVILIQLILSLTLLGIGITLWVYIYHQNKASKGGKEA
jgi:hypothetical protein